MTMESNCNKDLSWYMTRKRKWKKLELLLQYPDIKKKRKDISLWNCFATAGYLSLKRLQHGTL